MQAQQNHATRPGELGLYSEISISQVRRVEAGEHRVASREERIAALVDYHRALRKLVSELDILPQALKPGDTEQMIARCRGHLRVLARNARMAEEP